MNYKLVKKCKRKREYFETLRDLGACSSSAEAVERAAIWLKLAHRQRVQGYEEDIETACQHLERASSQAGAVLSEMDRLASHSLYVQDERGILFHLT